MSEADDRRELAKALALVGELGLTVVVSTVLLGAGGYLLDRRLGTAPVLAALGVLAGLAAGLWRCYRRISGFLE